MPNDNAMSIAQAASNLTLGNFSEAAKDLAIPLATVAAAVVAEAAAEYVPTLWEQAYNFFNKTFYTIQNKLSTSTPLHKAAQGDNAALLKLLSTIPKDKLNERDSSRFTPLMTAIYYKKVVNAQSLLDAGADINAVTNLGKTALYLAAEWVDLEAYLMLLKRGADPFLEVEHRSTIDVLRYHASYWNNPTPNSLLKQTVLFMAKQNLHKYKEDPAYKMTTLKGSRVNMNDGPANLRVSCNGFDGCNHYIAAPIQEAITHYIASALVSDTWERITRFAFDASTQQFAVACEDKTPPACGIDNILESPLSNVQIITLIDKRCAELSAYFYHLNKNIVKLLEAQTSYQNAYLKKDLLRDFPLQLLQFDLEAFKQSLIRKVQLRSSDANKGDDHLLNTEDKSLCTAFKDKCEQETTTVEAFVQHSPQEAQKRAKPAA
jgi:hypothetical protein